MYLAYAGTPVLRGLSFTAEAGRTTALVGPSGAGKSTVFNLLTRGIDAESGVVTLGGIPVAAYDLGTLRDQFSVVAQDSALFDETRAPLLTPREAKGMEFDHVVVVEPAAIVDEGQGGQGLRELYVALTRPTRTLVIVHARPLPAALAQRERTR